MTVFWIAAAAMIVVALLFITPALLGRRRIHMESDTRQNIEIARERLRELEALAGDGEIDQKELERERRDLEAALLDDLEVDDAPAAGRQPGPYWAVLVLVGVPLMAGGIYLAVGNPAALVAGSQQQAANPHAGAAGGKLPPVEELVAQLEKKLEENPDDPRGWALAARTYSGLGEYDKAVKAYRRLRKLVGDDPNVLVGQADAMIMASGRRFTDEAVAMLERAVEMQPDQPEGLWLLGMAAETRQEYAKALDYWVRLMPLLAEEPEAQEEVRALIRRVEAKSGLEAKSAETPAKSRPAAADAQVSVEVILDPALLEKVSPGDTVFVFARAPDGPPMPLAAARHKVSELPLSLVLDDSSAMTPQRKLSSFGRVLVAARISKSGNPTGASGDLESSPVEAATRGGEKVELLIDKVRP